jgi:hypothetical protein
VSLESAFVLQRRADQDLHKRIYHQKARGNNDRFNDKTKIKKAEVANIYKCWQTKGDIISRGSEYGKPCTLIQLCLYFFSAINMIA